MEKRRKRVFKCMFKQWGVGDVVFHLYMRFVESVWNRETDVESVVVVISGDKFANVVMEDDGYRCWHGDVSRDDVELGMRCTL